MRVPVLLSFFFLDKGGRGFLQFKQVDALFCSLLYETDAFLEFLL